jgi:hypothetical protein
MRALARTYRYRPLDRVVAARSTRLLYLSTPSALSANESTDVGFPHESVFEYDEALYRDLEGAWRSGDSAKVSALWARATPLGAARQS